METLVKTIQFEAVGPVYFPFFFLNVIWMILRSYSNTSAGFRKLVQLTNLFRARHLMELKNDTMSLDTSTINLISSPQNIILYTSL